MKLVHRLGADSRGATQIETVILAGVTLTIGLGMIFFGTHARSRFTEMETPAFAFPASRGSTPTVSEHGFTSTSAQDSELLVASDADALETSGEEGWLAYFIRKGKGLGRRALAVATIAPLPWSMVGIDAAQLEADAHYRAPIVSAVSQTMTFLVPALVRAAVDTFEDPEPALAALHDAWRDPVGIVRGMVTGTYESAVDWKTMLLADDDDESSIAASRIASSFVAGRMLAFGGRTARSRGLQRGLSLAHVRSPHFVQEALRKQQSATVELITFSRARGATTFLQTRAGKSSLGIAFIDNFSEGEGTALLRDAIVRSQELGHEGRLRATIAAGSQSFFSRRGFVPMFDDDLRLTPDYVLSKEGAETLLQGRLPRRAGLGEWVNLAEYEAARIQRYAPELYEDVKRIILPNDPDNYDFPLHLVPGYSGPAIMSNHPWARLRVKLDANATPDERTLALANTVGEVLFKRAKAPVQLARFPDAFAYVRTSISEEIEEKGAGILYEMETRRGIAERLGRNVASRYSTDTTAALERLTTNDAATRRTAGKLAASSDPAFDVEGRAQHYADTWSTYQSRIEQEATWVEFGRRMGTSRESSPIRD